MADEELTYEDYTVAELRDELTARGLPHSGTKDDLIARLEEDDTSEEVPETSTDLVPTEQEEAAPADPYKRIYSPFELPADPYAAQAFMDAHPGDVDPELKLPEGVQELAEENIQDAVDAHAARGTTVEDPRLPGYEPGSRAKELAAEVESAQAADVEETETADAV